MVEILRKQRQDVTAIACHVDGEQQADAPWTFRRVVLAFTVGGRGLDRERRRTGRDPAVEKYCAVLSTIAHAATIEHTTEIVEDGARPDTCPRQAAAGATARDSATRVGNGA